MRSTRSTVQAGVAGAGSDQRSFPSVNRRHLSAAVAVGARMQIPGGAHVAFRCSFRENKRDRDARERNSLRDGPEHLRANSKQSCIEKSNI